jgi:hypothetical protein
VNIIQAHDLSEMNQDELNRLSAAALSELIVDAVRSRSGELIS